VSTAPAVLDGALIDVIRFKLLLLGNNEFTWQLPLLLMVSEAMLKVKLYLVPTRQRGNAVIMNYLVPTRQRGNAVSTAPAVLDGALIDVIRFKLLLLGNNEFTWQLPLLLMVSEAMLKVKLLLK
jgi:hypothetical protein